MKKKKKECLKKRNIDNMKKKQRNIDREEITIIIITRIIDRKETLTLKREEVPIKRKQ